MTQINSHIGNKLLISNEEEHLAFLLRERNLRRANEKMRPAVFKETIYTKYVKRILDLLIALPAFIILLPFNIIFAVCTLADVGFPVLFRQARVGRAGRSFVVTEFRNMNEKKDSDGKLLPPSERVTKFGLFMRKYSLDELLNFWSVIKGDMSIIGPRPMPVFIVDRMCERHKSRLKVRPGLECPRVVKIDRKIAGAWQEEFENAVWYVENISFITDIKMVFRLIAMTFAIKKRSQNAGGLGYFVGYDDYLNATSTKRLEVDFPNAPYLKKADTGERKYESKYC